MNIDGMAQNPATPDEILRLSRPSRQDDETKISSGVSRSRRGVDLIETLQYGPKKAGIARPHLEVIVLLLDKLTDPVFALRVKG
jgi:hypothetical protein